MAAGESSVSREHVYLKALWSVWAAMSRVLGCQALYLAQPTAEHLARRERALARYNAACDRARLAHG